MSTGNYCKVCGSVLLGDGECYLCKTKAADAEAKAVQASIGRGMSTMHSFPPIHPSKRCRKCGCILASDECAFCGCDNASYEIKKGMTARPATEREVLAKARALLDEARKLMEGISMVGKFKVGDEVVNLRPHGWRNGIVVAVITAKESARRYCRKAGMSVRNFPVSGGVRDHESYLVESGGGIYQPSVWRMKLKGGGK